MSLFKFSLTVQSKNSNSPIQLIVTQLGKTVKSISIKPNSSEQADVILHLFCPDTIFSIGSQAKVVSLLSFFSLNKQDLTFGELTLNVQLVPYDEQSLEFRIKGQNLDDLDITSLSDPYFILKSGKEELYRSEVIMDNLNPIWKKFALKLNLLKDPIQFLVWDQDPGSDDFIGGCQVSKEDLLRGRVEIDIRNEKKKGDTRSGKLLIETTRIKNLAVRLFESFSMKVNILVPCLLDYSGVLKTFRALQAAFLVERMQYIGFGSAERMAWRIEGGDIFADELLKRKNVGPSVVGLGLDWIIRENEGIIENVVFVIVMRDIFDIKTVDMMVRKAREENCFVYFVGRNGVSYSLLESCPEVCLFKIGENAEDEVVRLSKKIVSDLESR